MTAKKKAKKPKKPAKQTSKKAVKVAPKKGAKPVSKPVAKASARPSRPSRAAPKPPPPRIPVRVMMPKVQPFTRPVALQSSNGNALRTLQAKPGFKPGAKGKPVVAVASMLPAGPKAMAKPPVKGYEAPQLIENTGFWDDVARHRDILLAYSKFV